MEEKHWFKQKDPAQNLLAVAKNLFHILGVPYTNGYLKERLSIHPHYPSLLSLADLLNEYDIEHVPVILEPEHLKELSYPAVAHLNTGEGIFVILREIHENQIEYLDMEKGPVKEPLTAFEEKWSGSLLLLEANDYSKEPDYKQHQLDEKTRQWSIRAGMVAGALFISLLFITGLFYGVQTSIWLPLILIKTTGIVVGTLLIINTFGAVSQRSHKLCKLGTSSEKLDCAKVLNSKAAKPLSWLSMAEIGWLYFSTSLLGLFLTLLYQQTTTFFWLLAWINVLSLPYTVFSIYYQARVAKKWCVLCLAVQLLLWLEFIVLHPFLGQAIPHFNWENSLILLLSYLLPLILWLLAKPFLGWSRELAELKQRLIVFENEPDIFTDLLSKSETIDYHPFEHEVHIGNPDAPYQLLIGVSPHCNHCELLFEKLESILLPFPDRIGVTIRFALCVKEDAHFLQWSKYLLSASFFKDQKALRTLIQDWYINRTSGVDTWAQKNDLQAPDKIPDIETLIREHRSWCKEMGLIATPFVAINNHILPKGFSYNDIHSFVSEPDEEDEDEL